MYDAGDLMTTDRLYYADSYVRHFTARVTERMLWDGRPAVALDRSAFYPEGGGQPGDRGTLNGVAVSDTQVRDGIVWHILGQQVDSDRVEGVIDWARRFDHMQQHHGQHLLSAAWVESSGFHTVSFHLGSDTSTIDLDTTSLSEEQVRAAESLANAVVWDDRPVDARFVTADELARLPLRKAPSVSGPVRVVSVADFDYSPCGGTHPHSTGGVGMIAIRTWSRQKHGTRVEFVCGGRALNDYRQVNSNVRRIASSLSVGTDQLETTINRLRATEATTRRELEDAHSRLLAYEAHELLANASRIGTARVVQQRFAARPPADLRVLAEQITQHADAVALLAVADSKAQLVVARGSALGVDAGAVLRAALPYVGGRGGGQQHLAQGGGPDVGGLNAALEAAADAVAQQLDS